MNALRIAVIQKKLSSDVGDALNGVKKILSKLDEDDDVDLVILPESWLVKDLYKKADEIMERYDNIVDLLESEASRLGAYLIGGAFFKKEGDERFIVSPIISPNGKLIAEQYKINLFRVENDFFATRPELFLFKVKESFVGVEICYDINFPEISREFVLNGADLILNPSRILAGGEDMWHLYIKARMLENRVPIIGVNVYYPSMYNGMSIAVNPTLTDKQIVRPKTLMILEGGEKVQIVEIDPNESRKLRAERVKEIEKLKILARDLRVTRV